MSHVVLVSVAHGDGVAGVIRNAAGQSLLTGAVESGGGTLLVDCRPSGEGIGYEQSVQGGLLPAGAVAARVLDDLGSRRLAEVANGAWAIVLDQPIPRGDVGSVCFLDGAGAPVAPLLPSDWPRQPVADAEEPCPACDAVGWDEVHPTDASRGEGGPPGGEMKPTPILVCRRCGHEESAGSWFAAIEPGDADPAQVARRIRAAEQARYERVRGLLEGLDFAVYAVEGHAAQMAGWGGGSGGTRVKVAHGAAPGESGPALRVETANGGRRYETLTELARQALEQLLGEDDSPWPERSRPAITIWLRTRDREHRRLAAGAPIDERSLLIDGVPCHCTFAASESRWAAVYRSADLTITVSARDVSPDMIALRALPDPIRALAPEPAGR